jgi:fumarate hydratase class II
MLKMSSLFFRFDVKIAAAVAEETDLPFVTAENKFEALVSCYVDTTLNRQ